VDLIVRHANIRFPRYIKFLESVIYLESTEEYDEEVRRFLGSVAYEVMSSPAVTVGPEMDVADLAELMFDKKVNPVPVVDDDGRLIGIISRSDLVRLMIREGQETSKT